MHIRDMKSLSPAVKKDVQKYWVVAKTKKPFSMTPIDQAHEQNNAIVKGISKMDGLWSGVCSLAGRVSSSVSR